MMIRAYDCGAADLGLLVLRLSLGVLLAGHATQKLFGWFRGLGPTGTGKLFEGYGVVPGSAMAIFAGVSELLGAVLIVLGLGSPLGSTIVVSTMVVAVAVNFRNGLWAHLGAGYEVALIYGVLGAVVGFTGPGKWSVDYALGLGLRQSYCLGVVALCVGVLACSPILLRRRLLLRRRSSNAVASASEQ